MVYAAIAFWHCFHPGSQKTWTWKLCPILLSQIIESRKIMPKVGPTRVSKSSLKSIEMESGPRSVSLVPPWAPGSRKWCPRYFKRGLKVIKITDFLMKIDPIQQSTCHAGTSTAMGPTGRRQGAKPLSAPRLGSALPSTACQTRTRFANAKPTLCWKKKKRSA